MNSKEILGLVTEYGYYTYLQGCAVAQGKLTDFKEAQNNSYQTYDKISNALKRSNVSRENEKSTLKSAVAQFGTLTGDSVQALFQDDPNSEALHMRSARLLDMIYDMIEEM